MINHSDSIIKEIIKDHNGQRTNLHNRFINTDEMKKLMLNILNTEQRAAVEATEGKVAVVAGPGTGKTRVLTHRYAYLVSELGISANNILCVTFTNKAAKEMKNRINVLCGSAGQAYTFHGWGSIFLREEIGRIAWPKNFIQLDEEDQKSILKKVYTELKLDPKEHPISKSLEAISTMKAELDYVDYMVSDKEFEPKNIDEMIFSAYIKECKKQHALDFDDLICFSLHILETNQEVREKWQKKYEYVMIDEFQDVSKRQASLAYILSEYHHNLFVVGDFDQTIYSWRGANVNIFLDFINEANTVINLKLNYRSLPAIILAANNLIEKNIQRSEKELIPTRTSDSAVVYNYALNTKEEATYIADKIEELHKNIPYSEIAILYRSHYVSRPIEEALIAFGIPYSIYSGTSFYARTEIKDILAYLRMVDVGDDISFDRVVNEPSRGYGAKKAEVVDLYAEEHQISKYDALKEILRSGTKLGKVNEFIEIIEEAKAKNGSIFDLLCFMLQKTGIERTYKLAGEDERIENIEELKKSILSYEEEHPDSTLSEYLQMISLYTNLDKEEKKNGAKLMTAHSSKGLEFPYVFVCGVNEGIWPSSKSITPEALEEERRLFYVALTRAQEKAYISSAAGQNFDYSFRLPSRFIFDIDEKLLKYERAIPEEDKMQVKMFCKFNIPEKSNAFSVGTHVRHSVFGDGIIVKVNADSYEAKFLNMDTTRTLSKSAKLEKI